MGCKHRLYASLPPPTRWRARQSWQDLRHLPLAAGERAHDGRGERAEEGEWAAGWINEKRNRRTHQGALQFWRALICSSHPLLPPVSISSLFLVSSQTASHSAHSLSLTPMLPVFSFSLLLLCPIIAPFFNLSLQHRLGGNLVGVSNYWGQR